MTTAEAQPLAGEDIAVIDLLDRLLCGGVVVAGDITLAVADIDLVYVSLRALISSVSVLEGGELAPQRTKAALKR
jgi:hypothetical protein